MSAFTVEFENRSGELARLCEAMAARGVNIVVCGAAHGDTGTVSDDSFSSAEFSERLGHEHTR